MANRHFDLPIYFRGTSVQIKLFPEYFMDHYGNINFSEQTGGGLDMSFPNQFINWGLGIQNLQITNKTSTYSYLSGQLNKFYLYLEKN